MLELMLIHGLSNHLHRLLKSQTMLVKFNHTLNPKILATKQRGYVLVLTIAALALLGLAGAFISQRITTALQLANAEQAFANEERISRDTLAQLMFLLATAPRTSNGIGNVTNSIKLDGRWYELENNMVVSLQDARGLVNFKTAPDSWKKNLLFSYGISTERITALLDTLADYEDTDNLKRLQGAEYSDYKNTNLPPPRNHQIISVHELLRIYGWQNETKLWGADGILFHSTFALGTGVNPSTATWRTLVAAFGMTEQAAKSIVEERKKLDPESLTKYFSHLTQVTGSNFLNAHSAVLFPSTTTLITITRKGSKRAFRTYFTITPESNNAAWEMSDINPINLEKELNVASVEKLPELKSIQANPVDNEKIEFPF